MHELRTERLLLRQACDSDLDAIHSVLSNAEATAYWFEPPHSSAQQSKEWLTSMIEIPEGTGEDFIVEHEGHVIGKVGFHAFPVIGFILHPQSWGRGFAREALAAVIRRAFEVHQLEFIDADVDPRNERSLRLLKGVGFKEVGRAERTLECGRQLVRQCLLAPVAHLRRHARSHVCIPPKPDTSVVAAPRRPKAAPRALHRSG